MKKDGSKNETDLKAWHKLVEDHKKMDHDDLAIMAASYKHLNKILMEAICPPKKKRK